MSLKQSSFFMAFCAYVCCCSVNASIKEHRQCNILADLHTLITIILGMLKMLSARSYYQSCSTCNAGTRQDNKDKQLFG